MVDPMQDFCAISVFRQLAKIVTEKSRNGVLERMGIRHPALSQFTVALITPVPARQRIAEGEEALQRILIRAREAGGSVSVYQEIAENEAVEKPAANPSSPTTVKSVAKPAPIQNIKPVSVQIPKPRNDDPKTEPKIIIADDNTPEKEISLPAETAAPLPFEFSNRVEEKARQTATLSPAEWQALVGLFAELLATTDQSLAAANLDFAAAFQKACAEVSADYPFLNPSSGAFQYKEGVITIHTPISAKIFAAAVTETLRRILEKLDSNP